MIDYELLNMLIRPHEFKCAGSYYATEALRLFPDNNFEFFSVNPIKESRKDLNVTSFRNFMFEMDSVPLEDQLFILKNCGIEWTSITYSGGKSYHAVLSLLSGLDLEVHTQAAVDQYKLIWRRIAAFIDGYARQLYEFPVGKKSFLDSSCQNPSRLTRTPGAIRSNGVEQACVYKNGVMFKREFDILLNKCPEISTQCSVAINCGVDVDSLEEFWFSCPKGLYNKLRYVDWAASEGVYPLVYRLACWIIDSTNASKEICIAAFEYRAVDKLKDARYDVSKVYLAIDHAYRYKRSIHK